MSNKVIFLVDKVGKDFELVFDEALRRRIAREMGVEAIPVFDAAHLRELNDGLPDTQIVLSTWNMPVLGSKEIAALFPGLRHIFYAAGTVKYFAEPYLEQGVHVYSAASINAEPVAEYATALILLAAKGFYRSRITAARHFFKAKKTSDAFPGNYRSKVGILGFGNIGRRVAAALCREAKLDLFAYDPYVSEEKCAELGVTKTSLDEIFRTCDVITNHMPDISETKGVVSAKLLSLMKPTATFINTGRGAQIDEGALASTLRRNRLQTAILDVTSPEPIRPWSPLLRCKNAYVTPHIAGSLGNEKLRMGEAMFEEMRRVLSGAAPLYEVTAASLAKGA